MLTQYKLEWIWLYKLNHLSQVVQNDMLTKEVPSVKLNQLVHRFHQCLEYLLKHVEKPLKLFVKPSITTTSLSNEEQDENEGVEIMSILFMINILFMYFLLEQLQSASNCKHRTWKEVQQ